MTGKQIVNQALGLLGYAESNGNLQLTQRVMNRILPSVNLVYCDLRRVCGLDYKKLNSLSEEIELPDKALDVFACGVAGYIALTEGDDNAQAVWSAEYSARRVTLSQVTEYVDVLPRVY